jgi:hypothetical protein
MTREKLWTRITERNPGLLTGKPLTARGVRQLFDLVWDEAQYNATVESKTELPDFFSVLLDGKMAGKKSAK